jgi:hypothetical protein
MFDLPATQSGTITYFYAISTKGGSADVYVDGVSKGTVSYYGPSGSNKSPVFGSSSAFTYSAISGGHHTLEIRPIKDGIYVDGFCLGSATPTGTPTAGPGTTTQSSGTQAAGESQMRSVALPTGTRAISVVMESSLKVPMQLILLDSSGRIVQTVNSSSGVAILETPISGGTYIIKTVNLSLGPIQVWSVSTPLVAR